MDDSQMMQLLYKIFDPTLPRLGPGDNRSTRKALETVYTTRQAESASPIRTILDIGCGNGSSTIQLAQGIDVPILAVDNHQPFLDELMRRATAAGVAAKIQTRCEDMHNLGSADGRFDLIWSEGAIYNMGFGPGLEMCRNLLVTDGQIALTELTWLKPGAPTACKQFFAAEYPAMVDTAANLSVIESTGYRVIRNFILPQTAWLENYYAPLENRLPSLQVEYSGDPAMLKMIDRIHTEIEMYRKYAEWYGYVFYVMHKA